MRSTRIRNGLPSPAETLHGRNLVTGEPMTVDHATVRATLEKKQAKYGQSHNRSHKVKKQRALVLGERCWVMRTNNEWTECFVTGIHGDSRSYQVVIKQTGRSMRCNRSHIKKCGFDSKLGPFRTTT